MTKKKIAVFGVAGLIVIIFIYLMSSPVMTPIQTKDGRTISAKTLTFPDGRKYVGEFNKGGDVSGYGILYKADGSISYEGEFIDGRPAIFSTTTSPSPTPVVTPTPTPAPEPAAKTYKSGIYKIGSDMPAGEYVLIGSGSTSYFEVDKDSTGQMDSILANDTFGKRSIITVADGQYLKLTGCIAYSFSDAPKVKLVDGFLLDGMYKVGVDLPAGEYKVIPEGGTSYKEVSKDSSHSLNSIISNDILQGEGYATIKNGQYLKLVGAKIKVQ